MQSSTESATFQVTGMSCTACAANIENRISKINGVKKISVVFANNNMTVQYDPALISISDLQNEARSIGYDISLSQSGTDYTENQAAVKQRIIILKKKLFLSIAFTLPVFIISMAWHHGPQWLNYILLILTIPVMIYPGAEFFTAAFKQMRSRAPGMDSLIAIGTGAAFLFSVLNTLFPGILYGHGLQPYVYYETAAVIITFVLLGRYIEERARSGASAAVKKLIGLQPEIVTVIQDGNFIAVPLKSLKEGEIVLIRPGERIPADGEVIYGTTRIDESMISGEPMPVAKKNGAKVFAGTQNLQGIVHVKVTSAGSATLLAKIIRLVENAQASKPPIQLLVDRISLIFVPVVFAIAVITFVVWIFLGPEPPLLHAFVTAVSVLVIACPCALGLATPAAIVAGIGRGANLGILLRDIDSLEKASRINTLVLDKTGTLTMGKPSVTNVWVNSDHDAADIKNALFSLESMSDHPLAQAIVKSFSHEFNAALNVVAFTNLPGEGVTGIIEGKHYFAGNRNLIEKQRIAIPGHVSHLVDEWASMARSLVWFSNAYELLAVIEINDPIKPDAQHAINAIAQKGIEIMLLSGDAEAPVKSVAKKLAINSYRSGVLPHEKHLVVEQLQNSGKVVAFAGDGINDAAALAQADIGISMASGSDIAIESAGITLMNSNPLSIAEAISLSRKTIGIVRQNLFWAFIYNILAIPIAAGVMFPIAGFLLDPMIAGVAMVVSSVTVVTNSMRLRWHKTV